MAIDRKLVLQLAAQRAGLTESQLDALRRRDYTALLAERIAAAPEPEPDLLLDQPPAASLQADLKRVMRRLDAVRHQRDAALHMIRQLAAKLGCCPHCWGTDGACATCAGRGSPGYFPPDPQLREWLAPALARGPDIGRSDPDSVPPPVATLSARGTNEWA